MEYKTSIYDLIYQADIKNELKQEIKNLEGAKQNISLFLGVLFKNKKTSFGHLQKYKIQELFLVILKFVKSNSKVLKEERNHNLYINYFLELLYYMNIKNEVGSLHYFNYRLLEKVGNISKEAAETYSLVNEEIFIRKVISEFNNFIDNLIEELKEELEKDIFPINDIKERIKRIRDEKGNDN